MLFYLMLKTADLCYTLTLYYFNFVFRSSFFNPGRRGARQHNSTPGSTPDKWRSKLADPAKHLFK